MQRWYARPVLFCRRCHTCVLVAEVGRDGCALILSCQWPGKVGNGLIFISLGMVALDAFRVEIKAKGTPTAEGHWGYRVLVVTDPDGNELYFPYENATA